MLINAAKIGDPYLLTDLVHLGANVNATDDRGRSALSIAAQLDETEVAKILINSGARTWTPDPLTSPIQIAAASGSFDVIPLLLSNEMPALAYNDALSIAAASGDAFVVTAFVNAAALSAEELGEIQKALVSRYHLTPGPSNELDPAEVMIVLKICRDHGLYSTDRCISSAVAQLISPLSAEPPRQDCDTLTKNPADITNKSPVKGVYWEKIEGEKAKVACINAFRQSNHTSRFALGLGRAYEKLQDYDNAELYYEEAIRLGNSYALIELSSKYAGDWGGPVDANKANSLLARAADFGQTEGLTGLSMSYERGFGVKINEERAVSLLRDAAYKGSSHAQDLLGEHYYVGQGVKKDTTKAFILFRIAASGDEVNRQTWTDLAIAYETGIGTKNNLVLAHRFYEMAADDGDPVAAEALKRLSAKANSVRDQAQSAGDQAPSPSSSAEMVDECDRQAASPFDDTRPKGISGVSNNQIEPDLAVPACRLALNASPDNSRLLYELGRALPKTEKYYPEALSVYRRAADAGYAVAMNNLGIMYQNGNGVAKDVSEAIVWYQKAAAAGNSVGMYNLGAVYANGNGVSKDYTQAIAWYRKAADAGNPDGMNNLGVMFENGTGVSKDPTEAIAWYRKAADAGSSNGMNAVGAMYEGGEGVSKDLTEAVAWYRKAAEAGNADAMIKVGNTYESGYGVSKDLTEAVAWYRRAADAGSSIGMTALGISYEQGEGVAKDLTEAVAWYRKAADAGSSDGMNALGISYEHGKGVAKDLTEAFAWYRKAAEAGNANAMVNVGHSYVFGVGVSKDYAQAVTWYRRAADARNAIGMADLGTMYYLGWGVGRDRTEAARWLHRAAQLGYSRAESLLRQYRLY